MPRPLALWALSLVPGLGWGEPQAQAAPLAAGYLNQLVGGLVLVVLAILILAWFLRKVPGLSAGEGPIQILAVRPIGTRERLLLVQVGSDQILIAVSPAGVQHLHTLSRPIEPPAPVSRPSEFAAWLERLRGNTHDEAGP